MRFGGLVFLLVVLVFVVVLVPGGGLWADEQKTEKVVQPNVLAGKWYPADADKLKEQVQGLFKVADIGPREDIVGLILPHAGYQYSGRVAAFGIKAGAGGAYSRVVVIGPSHYMEMDGVLSVPEATHYSTPLGDVELDAELIGKLKENDIFTTIASAHHREHSVQIQLPLLQHGLKDFKFVPVVAGSCSQKSIEKAADILRALIDEKTLVIASSDFTHYGPSYGFVPFDANIPSQIKQLDMGAYKYIAKLDGRGFVEYKQRSGATICGYVPVAILISMLGSDVRAELVRYETSGEMTGDFTNSVSYMAVAFYREKQKQTEQARPYIHLTEAEKGELLKLARQSLIYYLENNSIPKAEDLDFKPTDAMKKTGAAFVTLKRAGRLRGCIGHTVPVGSLYESVIANAIKGGINDWRFTPVTKDELKLISFEISALSEPVKVASYNDIRIGIDGVIFKKHGRSSVFLPQVARERNWDLKLMLKNLSLKAGLSAEDWQAGGEFYVFQALVFGEEKR